ncbi:MAG: hypothetical protein Q7U59_03635 [Lutibacter sp.]|nr:hypothetical protein [Lutibacter sp.]MDO9136637.1 hypothetical protein [Lutibacter sp.]
MKKLSFLTVALLFSFVLSIESCGPVVVTSRIATPPPPWFYPNRVEVVRYVYFPEFEIYYDFSSRNYLYFDNGIWITANILPPRYGHINLRRSHHIRINNYFGDDIKRYHNDNRNNLNRSNTSRRNPAVNRNPVRRN